MDPTESTAETQSVVQPPKEARSISEILNPTLSKLGNALITKMHVLMRISQIYDAKNVTFRQFVQESLDTANTLIAKEGGVSFKIVKDDFFINDQRLRYSVEGFTSFGSSPKSDHEK